MSTRTLLETLNKGICPDCGAEKFLEGPQGGLAQNIECATCTERARVVRRAH